MPTPVRTRCGRVRMADDEDFAVESTTKAGVFRRRRLSLWEKWMRAGSIDRGMYDAACRFEKDFHEARLQSRYQQMKERVDASPVNHDRHLVRVIDARNRVNDAMHTIGILGGSVVWDVVGEQRSISDHARRQRWSGKTLNVHEAKGRLVVALDALANHYGIPRIF